MDACSKDSTGSDNRQGQVPINEPTELELTKPRALPGTQAARFELVATWLAVPPMKALTAKAYRHDLRDFRTWSLREIAGHTDVDLVDDEMLARSFVDLDRGRANSIAKNWLASMAQRGLSPATISRRLCMLRSLVSAAHDAGLCEWLLKLKGPRVKKLRDVRGPSENDLTKLLRCARRLAGESKCGKRDLVIVLLAFVQGLRRSEMCGLNLSDVDLGDAAAIWIVGKGEDDKERLTLAPDLVGPMRAWVEARGDWPGPFLVRLDNHVKYSHGSEPERLTGDGARLVVRRLGERAGLSRKIWTHALRHAGATRLAFLSGGDFQAVRAFGRWKMAATALRYVDEAADTYGKAVEQLGKEAIGEGDAATEKPHDQPARGSPPWPRS